jgi:MFS family permease
MITERTIINFLIIGASFILVPFVISSSLSVDYLPVLIFGGLIALIVAFFFLKEKLCLCPMLGGSVLGSLNFLPLPLKAPHIACILLILYYISGYVIIRQKPIKIGKPSFLWPILIVTLIVLYHNHSLNVRVMGGGTEGAKPAILLYLVVLAYFCGINISSPSVDFFSKVPLISVILTAITCIPFILTTFLPSLAPYLYYITDNVNVQAYLETQAGPQAVEGIGRLSALGPLGEVLQAYLICHYPIGSWLRPERWWVAGLSFICLILVLSTGFRNNLFGYAMLIMVATCCYYSWRALFLPMALFIMALLFFVASSNNLISLPEDKLPLVAQRTLSFLPGDWDKEAIDSAKSSNKFRQDIQDVYIREYMEKSPLIGNGFNIDSNEFNRLSDLIRNGGAAGEDAAYLTAKTFIEGKEFHTGWLSVYDAVGIIGSLAFVALGLNEILVSGHFIFKPKADRRSSLFPLYVWLFCGIASGMVGFFTVFGDFGQTFSNFCIYAIVLSHLLDIENTTDVPLVLPDRKGQVEFTGLKGALYGYHSRP